VKTRKLELACPACQSTEVFYSCTPNCCFNHVCSSCGASFEPVTKFRGPAQEPVTPPDSLPDATDPTVACARCESTAVYVADQGNLVCAQCGSLLELEFTEIAAN